MRKIVLYTLLSLDGRAERPEEFVTEFDDVMRENLGSVIAAQDAVLLGRRTYDEWADYWPSRDIQPFADFVNNAQSSSRRPLPSTSRGPTRRLSPEISFTSSQN